jgi:hypothetical protein
VDRVHESPFSLLLNASGILKFGILLGFGVLGIGFSDAVPSNSPHFQSISNFFKAKKQAPSIPLNGVTNTSISGIWTVDVGAWMFHQTAPLQRGMPPTDRPTKF